MWGYEAVLPIRRELKSSVLRIPMWGYELFRTDADSPSRQVTNPHVGL